MAGFILLWFVFPVFFPAALAAGGGQDAPGRPVVRGVVRDVAGEPVIGASVRLKSGPPAGTVTDVNGFFELRAGEGQVLVISYIGYRPVEVRARSDREIFVTLEEDTRLIDEVVVVGYGSQKKATLTGSVDAVSSEKLNVSFNSNMQNLLTAKLAGVSVRQTTSEPGSFNSSINIRGMGEPLVVIDGIASSLNVFNRMSPAEIENVSVLKDASASVYGMKAGNGVLLVTTKKGDGGQGKPSIEYNGNLGFSKLINLNEPMNAYEFAVMRNEINRYKLNPADPMYSDEQLEIIRNTPGVDIYDQVMRKANPSQNHTVTVSGTTGERYRTTYFILADYLKEYGLYRTGDLSYNRYNLRSNVSTELGYGLTANVNLSYINDRKEQPYGDNAGSVYGAIWFMRPVDEYGNVLTSLYADREKGYYLKPPKIDTNPLALSDRDLMGYMDKRARNVSGQLGLTWDVPVIKGLRARVQYNFEEFQNVEKVWAKKYSLYNYSSSGVLVEYPGTSISNLEQKYIGYRKTNLQAMLEYGTSIARLHNIKLLGVFEQMKNDNPLMGFSAKRRFQLDSLDELFAGSQSEKDQFVWGDTPVKEVNQGIVGRVNYDYAGRYLLEAGFRYDGSSAFARGHRWGFFPSVSVGWRLSEEKFIKASGASAWIDNIKVRASYGKSGDDSQVKNNWASGYTYPYGSYIFNDVIVAGLQSKGVTNRNLTWYTSELYNVGVDFDLWKGLLSGTTDFYKRERDGLLATRAGSIPKTSGAEMPQENLNSDMTLGWEFSLSHRHRIRDFSYSVTGNFNIFRTKNRHVEGARKLNSYDNWRNNTAGRWNDIEWGHLTGGRITDESSGKYIALHQGTSQNALTGPGDYWHLDLNGDGWVTEWDDLAPVYTNTVPKVVYGFTLAAEYRGIDLVMVFNGAAKYTVTYEEFLRNPMVYEGLSGSLSLWTDRWHQDAQGNWIAGKHPRYRDEWAYVPNVWTDERRFRNASYLRLKNIELGYSFPKSIVSKIYLQKLRVYASAYNLLTFSGIREMDPEAPGSWSTYPMSQNFNFGINVTF